MPFPRFRLTIRRLMILVALSTLVPMSIVGWRWWTLRGQYLQAAGFLAEEQAQSQKKVDDHDDLRRRGLATDPASAVMDQLARRRLAYYDELKRKYEYAAAHPWEPEPTDPGLPFLELPQAPYIVEDMPQLAVDPTTDRLVEVPTLDPAMAQTVAPIAPEAPPRLVAPSALPPAAPPESP